jgi:hypothetical protein
MAGVGCIIFAHQHGQIESSPFLDGARTVPNVLSTGKGLSVTMLEVRLATNLLEGSEVEVGHYEMLFFARLVVSGRPEFL